MSELRNIVNIGPKLEEQLNNAGIYTYEELKEIGAKEAWKRIKLTDPSACLLRLRALEGAVQGIKRNELSDKTKEELSKFYYENK